MMQGQITAFVSLSVVSMLSTLSISSKASGSMNVLWIYYSGISICIVFVIIWWNLVNNLSYFRFITMVKKVFSVGDLVFAKVKGYPAWPARVTGRTSGGKYCVFFYGTFEVGNMKPEEMWPYNQKFRDRFGPPNIHKKWYSESLYQIEHTPDIAVQQFRLNEEDVMKRDTSSEVATTSLEAITAHTLPKVTVVPDKPCSDKVRGGMTGLIVFKEASLFLAEARDWTEEKVYSNASCILECARVVLKNRVSAGHEEKFECIKWLHLLARFVPSFNLETDLLNPMLSSVNEFLDNIIVSLDDDCGTDVKTGLLDMVTILLKHTGSVLDVTRQHPGFGIAEVPSLMEFVPQILQKTLINMDQDVGWKCKVKDIIVFFIEILESVHIRAVFQEELMTFNILMDSLIDLQFILVNIDLKLTMLVCSSTTNLATKYSGIMSPVKYNTGMEKVCWRLCSQVVGMVEKLSLKIAFMEKLKLEFKPSSNCQDLEDLKTLLSLFSEVSPQSSLLSLEDHKLIISLMKKLLGISVWDIEVYRSLQIEISTWWENLIEIKRKNKPNKNKCEGLVPIDSFDNGVTEDMYTEVDPECEGLENFEVVAKEGGSEPTSVETECGGLENFEVVAKEVESELTSVETECGVLENFEVIAKEGGSKLISGSGKSYFQLSLSFPLVPILLSECQHLPDTVVNKPPPDLAGCVPIPGGVGSFFILSSLVPTDQSQTKGSTKQPKKKKKKTSKRQIGSSKLFENKVQKSKLITKNLQKQRQSNLSKFKFLIKEVDGVFKCSNCSFESGWKSKAWSHSSRCGLNEKKAHRKPRLKTCGTCHEIFRSRKDLIKHFRSEHQVSTYFCVLCPKPTSFKFKNSFKRHCQLMHSKSAATMYKCNWCRYQATQKTNLRRHIQRIHKTVTFAENLVELVIEKAIMEVGLCKWERIRLNNLREKRRMLQELFPERDISPQSPVKSKKVRNRMVPQKSRISPRQLEHLKEICTSTQSEPASSVMDDDVVEEGLRKEYCCLICEFKCRRKLGLSRHVMKQHQPLEEPLPCSRSFCDLTFPTRWQKEIHVAKCWLICQEEHCNHKQFRRQDKYNQHLRMHKRRDDLMEN